MPSKANAPTAPTLAMSSDAIVREIGIRSGELLLTPPQAAAIILDAIERRKKRVLVGRDAKMMAFIQWLFPVKYHQVLARIAK